VTASIEARDVAANASNGAARTGRGAKPGAGIAAPRLLLSARGLSGVARASRDRLIEMTARTREPEALAVTLSKAIDAGAEAVLVAPSPQLRNALAELRRPVPLLAVLPSVEWQEALDLEPGLDSRLERARRLAPFGARMRARLAAIPRLAAVRRGDWAALLPLLIELEAARLSRGELAGVVLAAEVTDIALAAGNSRMFARYAQFVRRRFRVPAGLETRNLGTLLDRLQSWNAAPDFVVGPMNPPGLAMKPSQAEAVEAIARSGIAVIASDLRAGGAVSLADGASYARSHGAHGLAPDLVELDDVASALKSLARSDAG
jgi:hypothetical protein